MPQLDERSDIGHAQPSPTPDSAYVFLAGLDPELPLRTTRQALLRRLVEITGAAHARLWLSDPDAPVEDAVDPSAQPPLRHTLVWPTDTEPADPPPLTPSQVRGWADVRECVLLQDDDRVHTALVLYAAGQLPQAHQQVQDTATCLLVVHRRAELQTRRRDQDDYTDQLAGEVLDSSRQLARVGERERRRVGAQVTAFAQGRFDALRGTIERLMRDPQQALDLAPLRAQHDRLVSEFRSLVRGIHPRVLYQRGLHSALSEAASSANAGTVQVHGWVPARLDHEVAASLYYLTAAAVHVLSRPGTQIEIVLGHRHRGPGSPGIEMRLVTGPLSGTAAVDLFGVLVGGPSVEEVQAALVGDSDRLGGLGGRVTVTQDVSGTQVSVWVPDRLEPTSRATLVAPESLHAKVRAQALILVARYAEGPGSAQARRLLARLDEPVAVAFTAPPGSGRRIGRITEAVRDRRDLVLLPATQPGTRPDSASVPADVTVRPTPATPQESFDVQLPGSGLLRTDLAWRDLPLILTTQVVARTDVLRARTTLIGLIHLVRTVPLPPGSTVDALLELQQTSLELADLESRLIGSGSAGQVPPVVPTTERGPVHEGQHPTPGDRHRGSFGHDRTAGFTTE